MRPSYDDLLEIIEALKKKVAHLEERLGLNSQNSSKPPSTDQKKNKKPSKGGAKPGHLGSSRKLLPEEQVTKQVVSELRSCPHCGTCDLEKKDPLLSQQVEIPKIAPLVTQFEQGKAYCPCCDKNLIAPFPKGYDQTAFGPQLISWIGVASSVYRLSKRSIQDLLKATFGIEISLGSIPAMERKVSKGLAPTYEAIQIQINEEKVGYADETPFRELSKTCYVWSVTTSTAAFLRILPTRGLKSLNQIRPREHPGVTVSDRYAVYSYNKHQYCLAHIKRDLQKFSQRDGPDGELAKRALFELKEIFIASRLKERSHMRQRVGYRRRRLEEILHDICREGSKTFSRLASRLLDVFEKLFTFTRYRGVEPTNNAAERTLRHIVLWRKTSYGTQSYEGSRFIERAVTILMTLKKRGKEIWPFFSQAYRSTFDPQVPAPTI